MSAAVANMHELKLKRWTGAIYVHFISLWWARGEDKSRNFFLRKLISCDFCLSSSCSLRRYVSQFRFRFSDQFCCHYSFITGRKKEGKQNIKKEANIWLLKKIKTKLKKKEKKTFKKCKWATFLIGQPLRSSCNILK